MKEYHFNNEIDRPKPCPFCGAIPGVEEHEIPNKTKHYTITCRNPKCTIRPYTMWYIKKEDAVNNWNKRVWFGVCEDAQNVAKYMSTNTINGYWRWLSVIVELQSAGYRFVKECDLK